MKKVVVVALLLIVGKMYSQSNSTKVYPQGYFQWPVPLKREIVANMGELRPNHWHMGLDIRTAQKENQLVNAAAAGYISHIGIRPQSFGRFIVITHPNGLSTLYGHLNDFYPALEAYVTTKQYEKQSWAIELDFTKDQFPVTKGQFIAFSGNTGGSQGPHVHFEIFDTQTTKRYNPLLFGFGLEDNVAPDIVKLAMYDRSKSLFAQSPQFFSLKKTDSGYIIPKIPILKTGLRKVSFALQAYDRMSGSANADGIYSARIAMDNQPLLSFVIDSVSYDETAYMNAQIDYKLRYNGGAFLQHLSRLPGDHGPVYHPIQGDGVIELNDTNTHAIKIEVKDANQNTSVISLLLQHDDSLPEQPRYAGTEPLFVPNQQSGLDKPDFKIKLGQGCLYDTIYPVYFRNNSSAAYAVSSLHQVNDASFPIHDDVTVLIKPDRNIPPDWKDRILIQRSSRGSNIRKANWETDMAGNLWLSARFGDLGTYQAFADVVAPVINDLGKGDTINLSASSRIVFTPSDNFGIRSFRAELDGQWLRFTNDKSRNWIYIFDERCPYGVHELKVTVEDLVGNTTTRSWWFKKLPYTPPPPKKKNSKKKSTVKTSVKKPVAKKAAPKKKK